MKLLADISGFAVIVMIALAQPALAQEQEKPRSNAGAILGGIAGAVIGNQIGGGSGRAAATAILGVAGAVAGDHLDNDRTPPALRPDSSSHRRSPAHGSFDQDEARGNTGAVIGGIAGAIVGSQIGKGNGRTAATAVLAITGAIAGDRLENDRDRQQPQRRRIQAEESPHDESSRGNSNGDQSGRSTTIDFNQFASDPRVSVR